MSDNLPEVLKDIKDLVKYSSIIGGKYKRTEDGIEDLVCVVKAEGQNARDKKQTVTVYCCACGEKIKKAYNGWGGM